MSRTLTLRGNRVSANSPICIALVVLLAFAALETPVVGQQRSSRRQPRRSGATAPPSTGSFDTGRNSRGQFGQNSMLGPGDGFGGGGNQGPGTGQGNPGLGMDDLLNPNEMQNQQRDGFVGRDAQDMRDRFNNLSRRDRRNLMFDMAVENLNEMRNERRRNERNNQPAPTANLQLIADVEVDLRSPLQAAEAGATRAQEGLQRRKISGVLMSFEKGAIVLRGEVKSEYERALAEQLASLEPGVLKVENQLVVAAPQER